MNTRSRVADNMSSEEKRKKEIAREYQAINEHLKKLCETQITARDIQDKCENLTKNLTRSDSLSKEAFKLQANKIIEHDAEYMRDVSQINQLVVKALAIDSKTFDPSVFAEKLITHIGLTRDPETGEATLDADAFAFFGKSCSYLINTAPVTPYMYGAFEPGSVHIPPKRSRKVVQKEKDVLSPEVIKPKTSSQVRDDELKNGAEVEQLYEKINEACEESGQTKVRFEKILIDPDSFGKTVEAVFHLSFLVKMGRVALLDEEEGLMLEPIEVDGEQEEPDKSENVQTIMSFNMDDWKKWVSRG
ncbi:SMC5-SMC6 complex kleisin component Non-SMC element 1 [Brevipalpus obovatus]|uniref:SMC5-SMC6 complex kleisin component Non-SMC element 1 n=1 Tax=Brevipalpus obovatus TaxID=246614 RepID=UPI003D9E815B